MNKIAAGAVSGFAATVPMTIAMEVMHRLLPPTERYALPPRHITMNVAKTIGVKHRLDHDERAKLTLAAHFGYGSAMGAIFAMFWKTLPGTAVAKGIGWGLIVWAASYLGALPAANLHEPATEQPAGRNALMIFAHVIWGASLGAMLRKTDQ